MKRVSVAAYSAVVVLGLLVIGSAWVAGLGDPHLGTWKQNFAKSKSDPPPAGPAPQSVTRTYEVFEGDGLKYTNVAVSADGKRTTTTYSAHLDGKDVPFLGSPNFDTIALKRIDASSFDFTIKKAGKVTSTGTNAVSKDGKMFTQSLKGTNASGQPTSGVAVFEKQ